MVNNSPKRRKILFVDAGNAGPSQVAAALFQRRYGRQFEVASASVAAYTEMPPLFRELLANEGLEALEPHPVCDFTDADLDIVVTIGEQARTASPIFPGAVRRLHWNLPDTPQANDIKAQQRQFSDLTQGFTERLDETFAILTNITARPVKMALATSTAIFIPEPLNPARDLPLLAQAGFEMFELNCFVDEYFPWRDAAAVKELARVAADIGLPPWSIHPPECGRLGAADPAERNRVSETVKRCLDLAATLGAATVVFHAGVNLEADLPRGEASQWVAEGLAELAAHAQGLPVILGLETMPNRGPLHWSNDEILAAVRQANQDSLGLVIDTGHTHMAGDLAGLPQRAGRRLVSLHLHDNDGAADTHNLPGMGTVNWRRLLSDLREADYRGPLMLEAVPRDMTPAQGVQAAAQAGRWLLDQLSEE